MPPSVRTTGSWVSLSVIATGIVTSISLSIIYFFGDGVMTARENRIEVPHIIKSLDHLVSEGAMASKQVREMLDQTNRNALEIAKLSVEIGYSKNRLNDCENSHRSYHHEERK